MGFGAKLAVLRSPPSLRLKIRQVIDAQRFDRVVELRRGFKRADVASEPANRSSHTSAHGDVERHGKKAIRCQPKSSGDMQERTKHALDGKFVLRCLVERIGTSRLESRGPRWAPQILATHGLQPRFGRCGISYRE